MQQTHLCLLAIPMAIPAVAVLLAVTSSVMFLLGLVKPTNALFWYKGERTKRKSKRVYGGLFIVCFAIFMIGIILSDEDVKQNDQTSLTPIPPPFDTTAYLTKIKSLSQGQIDSLIDLQLDKDSNHKAFLKIITTELERNHIEPKQVFPATMNYFKNFLKLYAGGTYEMKNEDGITFQPIYSFDAVYDLYGNLVSVKMEGLQDASVVVSTHADK